MLIEKYDVDKDIGKRVKELKNANHELVKDVADLISVSDSYMSRLLMDKARWSMEFVEIISDHYKVSQEYLIYGRTYQEKRGKKQESFDVQFTEVMLTVSKQPIGNQIDQAVQMMETTAQVLRRIQDEMQNNETRPSK